jgi:hypothetical protein
LSPRGRLIKCTIHSFVIQQCIREKILIINIYKLRTKYVLMLHIQYMIPGTGLLVPLVHLLVAGRMGVADSGVGGALGPDQEAAVSDGPADEVGGNK